MMTMKTTTTTSIMSLEKTYTKLRMKSSCSKGLSQGAVHAYYSSRAFAGGPRYIKILVDTRRHRPTQTKKEELVSLWNIQLRKSFLPSSLLLDLIRSAQHRCD